MDTEPLTLVCAEVIDANTDEQIEGSIILICERCERDVWCAPSGQDVIAERYRNRLELLVLCVPCGLAAMTEDDDRQILDITEAQARELREHYRR